MSTVSTMPAAQATTEAADLSDAAGSISAMKRPETPCAVAAAGAACGTPGGTPARAGTLIPNRVFVGGIPSSTGEADLREFFSGFGEVRDVKIIVDKSGLSKGYGFVTFESAEVAEFIIQRDSQDGLVFRQRKLNIGPAIKKHSLYPRPDPSSNGVFFTAGSVPYTYQNGMAVFHIPGSLYHHHMQPQQLPGAPPDLAMQYAQQYSVAAAAAAAAGQAVPAGAQLMCLPAGNFLTPSAVWPAANPQSPGTGQSNTPTSGYYPAAPLPCYSSPLTRTPGAIGLAGHATDVSGYLSATSDYGTDPSYTDPSSFANESVDFDCSAVYQQPQHLATAFSPSAYCYGSPPVLCPVRAYPVLLNPPLATPPPPAPVARIPGGGCGACRVHACDAAAAASVYEAVDEAEAPPVIVSEAGRLC